MTKLLFGMTPDRENNVLMLGNKKNNSSSVASSRETDRNQDRKSVV